MTAALLLALVQTPVTDGGRAAVEALQFPELTVAEAEVGEHEVLGVPVFHLYDPTLPLVDVELFVAGGVSRLGRDALAPLTALPVLLRTGGTAARSRSEVERAIDLLGLQLGMGSGGGGMSVDVNGLRDQLEPALSLLAEMLLEPAFDPEAVETWRRGEIERLRRRRATPGSVAFSEFNRLMYGDSPTGWLLEEADLSPESLSTANLRALHADVACRGRLYVGLSGDITWDDAASMLEEFLARWPECTGPLPSPLESTTIGEPGVFLVPMTSSQSVIVAGQAADVRLADSPDYFAVQIANFVLGGGLSSRIISRMRSQSGLVYSASSVWTTPLRQPGLVGGYAASSVENTVRTTRMLVSVLDDFRSLPPTETEMDDAVRAMEGAFAFALDTPARIVSRRIAYRLQGLPDDWLARYLAGLRSVDRSEVARVVAETIDPSRLTILIAGDPDDFDTGVETLGPVFVVASDGTYAPRTGSAGPPGGSPRSPR